MRNHYISLQFVTLGLAYRPKIQSHPAFNLVVQLFETLVGWASCAPKAAIQINTPGRTDGQKPGFFAKIFRYKPQKRQKTKVVKVLMRKSQAKKS